MLNKTLHNVRVHNLIHVHTPTHPHIVDLSFPEGKFLACFTTCIYSVNFCSYFMILKQNVALYKFTYCEELSKCVKLLLKLLFNIYLCICILNWVVFIHICIYSLNFSILSLSFLFCLCLFVIL